MTKNRRKKNEPGLHTLTHTPQKKKKKPGKGPHGTEGSIDQNGRIVKPGRNRGEGKKATQLPDLTSMPPPSPSFLFLLSPQEKRLLPRGEARRSRGEEREGPHRSTGHSTQRSTHRQAQLPYYTHAHATLPPSISLSFSL